MHGSVKKSLEDGVEKDFQANIDSEFISSHFNGVNKRRTYISNEMFKKDYLMENYLEYHLRAIVTENGMKTLNQFIKQNNNLMNKKLLYILICTLTLFDTKAQNSKNENYNFTLQGAIDFAVINNRIAKNAGRDVLAAEKQKWETIAVGLPQINAGAGYDNNLELQKILPANIFDPNADPDLLIPAEFGVKHNVNAAARVDQLIFDGSYIVGLQSVGILDIPKLAKEKTDLEVRKSVIKTYTNVLFASKA